MTELTQDNLLTQKAILDKVMSILSQLADAAAAGRDEACKAGNMTMRESITRTEAHLRAAHAELLHARAYGGEIEGGGVTRAGGT